MATDPYIKDLEVYLVGGAVRDALLGREVRDRDWVVVGSRVEDMRARGFAQVGRDFPVFLHPETHEEYALARIERKTGVGHVAFSVNADPGVTLTEDLERRDLTINAMAQDLGGELHDPYGGRNDLKRGILRHVSPAFAEDPLRVFRVARFAAQLPGFEVAEETLRLMRAMASSGELGALSAERVWQELTRALASEAPARFLVTLQAAQALDPWLQELGDTRLNWAQTESAAEDSDLALIRFARLGMQGEALMALCDRLRAPRAFLEAARDALDQGEVVRSWRTASAERLLHALESMRSLQDTSRLEILVRVVFDRAGMAQDGRALVELATQAAAQQFAVDVDPGPAYGAALRAARLAWLEGALS